jgi:hypothetical protein
MDPNELARRYFFPQWRSPMKTLLSCLVGVALCTASSGTFAQEKEKKDKPDAKPQKVELAADLVADAPGDWKSQKPKSQLRTHEFVLPSGQKDVADGILFVMHFGKGSGGGLEENLKRWYGMVEQPDGGSTEKSAKKEEIKDVAGGKVVWLDMSGTYLDRPAPQAPQVTKRPNYRVFAAMIDTGKDGPYWVRAYGPESVMKAQRDGFEKFLKSIAKK